MIQDLHAQVRNNIERKAAQYQMFANEGRKDVTFKEGDGYGSIWERKGSLLKGWPFPSS